MSEQQAVFSLFRPYYDELLGFLTAKLGCREQAADMVQDTYVRILSLKHPHAIVQPRAFLYKTAINLTVDEFRRQRLRNRWSAALESIEELQSDAPDQEAVVESKERLDLLRQAIHELPPKCRHVFLLHKFMDLRHAEIAERLGISKNMVEKHVIKGLAYCRKRVEGVPGKMVGHNRASNGSGIAPVIRHRPKKGSVDRVAPYAGRPTHLSRRSGV
jgi:RNA polymerase sigma factor (sigma-70 family)